MFSFVNPWRKRHLHLQMRSCLKLCDCLSQTEAANSFKVSKHGHVLFPPSVSWHFPVPAQIWSILKPLSTRMWLKARRCLMTTGTPALPRVISIPACTRRPSTTGKPPLPWQTLSPKKRAPTLDPGTNWRMTCWEISRCSATGPCTWSPGPCHTNLGTTGLITGCLFLNTCGLPTAAHHSNLISLIMWSGFSPRVLQLEETTRTAVRRLCRLIRMRSPACGAMMWGGCR